jgi:hypothetical protein
LALCLLLPGLARAAWLDEVKLYDWVYPGEANYELLKTAAAESGSMHWMAARLAKGERVPQASARDFAGELSAHPALSEARRQQLAKAFPPEAASLSLHGTDTALSAKDLDRRLQAVDERVDMLNEAMKKNNFDKGSFPSANLSLLEGYNMRSAYGLFNDKQRGNHISAVSVTLHGETAKGNFDIYLSGSFGDPENEEEFPLNEGGPYATGLGVVFEYSWGGLEVSVGQLKYVNFSTLIYSGLAYPDVSPFFASGSTVPSSLLDPPSARHFTNGIYLRKNGPAAWWPFQETQFLVTPERFFQRAYNHNKIQETAGRLDIPGDPAPFLGETHTYFAFNLAGNDQDLLQADPDTAGGVGIPQSSQAYALGLNSNLAGGGGLWLEIADSHWGRSDTLAVNRDFHDQAAYMVLSKPFSLFSMTLEASHLGPRFITRIRDGRPSAPNAQSGATLDSTIDDPRPGSGGALTWQTISREPAWMVNNNDHAVLRTELAFSLFSLGLNLGSSKEIEPSGPWLETSAYLDGRSFNGYGWYDLFGKDYIMPAAPGSAEPAPDIHNGNRELWIYNKATEGPALANGVPITVNWNQLAQTYYRDTSETLLLSRSGTGDMVLRADSIKFLNSMGANLKVDFRSLWGGVLPSEVNLVGEVRDTAESLGVADFGGKNLLTQSYAIAYARFGLTREIDLLGMAGYETWISSAGYFPLHYINHSAGLGFDFKLSALLTGLDLRLRARILEHVDSNFGQRNFGATYGSLTSNLEF